ncbi:annexin D4 [Morus notabilis]|uniref:annexin D4 n=1 Tax=Morus notabilis TaxID=981085 RepID=UPI000CED01D5|nr:annexin D4 [Morus notabilis]
MALSDVVQNLSKAFSDECGLGVDEKSLIENLGKWKAEERKSFWKANRNCFVQDERLFERCDEDHVKRLEKEFLRFKGAVVLRAMHPWERDARLVKRALKNGSSPGSLGVLIEIACTRSSDELLGARRAYHSLFDRSIEEDAAHHIKGPERKLLVALLSAYRYEGPKVKDDNVKSDVKELANAIKNADKKSLLQDDEVIRILSTRSRAHLKEVYDQYHKNSGKNLDEDIGADSRLQETVQCLCVPQKYFTKVLDAALKKDADKKAKKALTRVIVTRADADMKQIREEFQNQYGVSLSKKIEDAANGNYKDFLLALVGN